MRAGSTPFFDRWSDPTFQPIGVNRTRGIVTCEPDWYLNAQSTGLGSWPAKKRPVRWWQRADNSQVEIEIPNIKMVNWEKSIESDAATCTVTLANQWMKTNFAAQLANELGMPGYFTFDRGDSQEARTRWKHTSNEWNGRLVPGALLRTYEGHGGFNIDGSTKTREEMLAAGDIMLTGVWQVDDVTIGARSKLIELRCRDMMALLLDQILYPPLVPSGLYPLRYQRWVDTTEKTNYTPAHPSPPVFGAGAALPISYETSSVDAWYGPNFRLHGHSGTDSIDGNPGTYALSVGNSGPDKPFATDYWQYNTGGQQVGGISVHCWQGGYQMFISAMENGRWIGDQIIPYDFNALEATQPGSTNTGANIPYMMQVGCPVEQAFTVAFPRPVNAQRIRITFRHLVNSGIGPWLYRAGVREFQALTSVQVSAGSSRFFGWHALESHPTADGYWTMSFEGKVHAFGQCVNYGDEYGKSNETWVGIAATPTGLGYWLLAAEGRVAAFGDAVHLGEHLRNTPVDFAASSIVRTHTGEGYWVGYYGGAIYNFGDAPAYAPVPMGVTPAFGEWPGAIAHLTSHPSAYGLWILTHDGTVHVRGAATNLGIGGSASEHLSSIDAMPDGNGYLIVRNDGEVRPLGSAVGAPVVSGHTGAYMSTPDAYAGGGWLNSADSIVVNFDGSGYWVLSRDGEIYSRGNANRWGSPKEGVITTRRDGNYCADDQTEILTPRGWLHYDEVQIGDSALAIDPTTGLAAWQEITVVFRKHREHVPMIKMAGRQHDSLTTRDHRWLTINHQGQWAWKTTETLNTGSRIPTAAQRSDAPDLPKYSDDFVELIAWFYTEGSLSDGRACISQSQTANPSYWARIDACMRRLYGNPGPIRAGHLWTTIVNPSGTTIWRVKRSVRDEWTAVAPDRVPTPEFLNSLTLSQLRMFVETSIDADGHRRADNGVAIFTQVDERRIKAFEMACVLDGRAPNTTQIPTGWSCTARSGTTVNPVSASRADTANPLQISEVDHTGVIWCPTLKHHNWLARRNGKIYFTGNTDYADIVKDLLLWSGWFFKETVAATGTPEVYGNIETTGIYSPDPLPPDMFDKRHPIDPIKQLKEIVGYICWVDDEGAFRWESPNWWQAGNYYTDGEHTDFIPEIDERIQLTDYTTRFTKSKDRSKIIITTDEPTAGFDDTVTTEYTPSNSLLRGQVIPAMVKVPTLVTKAEQEVFAELIALHLWFARRAGNVTIEPANPALMINDQVRIFERVTAETYIHYVRGISSSHDFETGVWTQTLTTNWLGTEEGTWAVTADQVMPVGESAPSTTDRFVMSPRLLTYIEQLVKSPLKTQVRIATSDDVDAPDPGDGAATT